MSVKDGSIKDGQTASDSSFLEGFPKGGNYERDDLESIPPLPAPFKESQFTKVHGNPFNTDEYSQNFGSDANASSRESFNQHLEQAPNSNADPEEPNAIGEGSHQAGLGSHENETQPKGLVDIRKSQPGGKRRVIGVVLLLVCVLIIISAIIGIRYWFERNSSRVATMPAAIKPAGDTNSVGANAKSDAVLGVDAEKSSGKLVGDKNSGDADGAAKATPASLGSSVPGPLSGPGAYMQKGPGQPLTIQQPPAVDQYGRPLAPMVPPNRFDSPLGAQDGRGFSNTASGSGSGAGSSASSGGSGSSGASLMTAPAQILQQAMGSQGAGSPVASGGSFGGNLTPAKTPKATATLIGNRSLMLAQGANIPCVLDDAIASDQPSMPRCHAPKDIYSDDGKVVLAEAGTVFVGESGAVAMKNGQSRLYVLWTRLKTPHGVIVNLDSPGADALGRGGLSGDLDKRWGERIGSAFLLSLVQDSIAYAATRGGNSNSPAVFQSTTNTGNQMATEVLKDSLTIPPRLTINQGEIVSIRVARDIDFSDVYQLRAK